MPAGIIYETRFSEMTYFHYLPFEGRYIKNGESNWKLLYVDEKVVKLHIRWHEVCKYQLAEICLNHWLIKYIILPVFFQVIFVIDQRPQTKYQRTPSQFWEKIAAHLYEIKIFWLQYWFSLISAPAMCVNQ